MSLLDSFFSYLDTGGAGSGRLKGLDARGVAAGRKFLGVLPDDFEAQTAEDLVHGDKLAFLDPLVADDPVRLVLIDFHRVVESLLQRPASSS